MASSIITRCAWPGQGESVTELMLFMNFLVHSYTCCSDRHTSLYWTFVDEFWWVSPLHYLKYGWQNTVLLWRMLLAGTPSLYYYCAVVLHTCIVLPPVGHSSNHEYHCCQPTRKSSCVSNFYRTFKVFIWLSLVHNKKGQGFQIPLHMHFGRDLKSIHKVYKDINNCLSAAILLEETKLRFQFKQEWPFHFKWTRN